MDTNKGKTVLVIGASPNSSRYSYKATLMLADKKHVVIPFGIRKGQIENHQIVHDFPEPNAIDTITLYMNPERQKPFYTQLLNLNPKRIIFNPGTENSEFEALANEKGIETENACTLVLLSLGSF